MIEREMWLPGAWLGGAVGTGERLAKRNRPPAVRWVSFVDLMCHVVSVGDNTIA